LVLKLINARTHRPSALQIEATIVEEMAQSDVHHGEEAKEVKIVEEQYISYIIIGRYFFLHIKFHAEIVWLRRQPLPPSSSCEGAGLPD
jgi:hypothetical protein